MTPELVLQIHRDEFYGALVAQDWDRLARLYGKDYMLVRSDGSVLSKLQVLDDLRAQNLVFESIELSEEKVRILSSVAVLTGKSRTRLRHNGARVESCFRLIALYAEIANKLELIHFQSTLLTTAGCFDGLDSKGESHDIHTAQLRAAPSLAPGSLKAPQKP